MPECLLSQYRESVVRYNLQKVTSRKLPIWYVAMVAFLYRTRCAKIGLIEQRQILSDFYLGSNRVRQNGRLLLGFRIT